MQSGAHLVFDNVLRYSSSKPSQKWLIVPVNHLFCCADAALLQAYGAAVVEEAPIFAITNYEVTFFCRRHLTDVKDTRIWASPPIAWNSASLPPRAAWLHFLAVAQHCRSVYSESLLRRDEVPSTSPSGYSVVSSSAATVKLNASEPNRNQTDGT